MNADPARPGLIERYRERLPFDEGDPVITLGEGSTPLVHAPVVSEAAGVEVWLKLEGANPTGSFKDRGMTCAVSDAVRNGAEAVLCASTGNTAASLAAYAARAGIGGVVIVPEGKIAAGKLAQVAQLLGLQGASIRSVVQKGLGENARLVMVTHPILESRFYAALELIAGLDFIRARPRAIRVIDEEFV